MNTIPNHFRLDRKVALVTGCKRGIGKAMAVALAEAGADIIGVSVSLEAKGSLVEQEVTSLGRKFSPDAFPLRPVSLRLVEGGRAAMGPAPQLTPNQAIRLPQRSGCLSMVRSGRRAVPGGNGLVPSVAMPRNGSPHSVAA